MRQYFFVFFCLGLFSCGGEHATSEKQSRDENLEHSYRQTVTHALHLLKEKQKDSLAMMFLAPPDDSVGYDNDVKVASRMLNAADVLTEKDILYSDADSALTLNPDFVEYRVNLFVQKEYIGKIRVKFFKGNPNIIANLFVYPKIKAISVSVQPLRSLSNKGSGYPEWGNA